MGVIKEILKKINIKDTTILKCVDCGEEISSDWYYKKKGKCGDYSYIGYCATCEDLARYTGNL